LLYSRAADNFNQREARKMKKRIIVIGLIAVMVIGASYASAQGPGPGPGPGRMEQANRGPQNRLNLAPDQKAKLQELRRKFNDETAQLRGSLLTKRLELRSLWTNPKADSKSILQKESELKDLQNQFRDKSFQMRLEARNILTPEQLDQIGKGRGAGPGFGRGHMMGPGGQGGMMERGGRMGHGGHGGHDGMMGPGAGRYGGMW
jgi:Spy/CpxP family protein refolding chaperone